MRISMIGPGHIGLVPCARFGRHEATSIDQNEQRLARLKHREIPIYEPDLNQLIALGANGSHVGRN
ncbi:hypothetical protein [Bradyrhizobium cenepequi]|uniref:hypothetical protein n=1 Tax=Bradyrhizobium cenepequi TaxID=2821403 RepID=UPI001CE3351B|nr:hypothetical protein [Bradyrhizobium cenepequi]MCA6107132.1 hypothetical protein [Bradyrhizobium cenepequi]